MLWRVEGGSGQTRVRAGGFFQYRFRFCALEKVSLKGLLNSVCGC